MWALCQFFCWKWLSLSPLMNALIIFQKQQPEQPELLLKILKNSQKNTCARVSFLIKLQASGQQFCWKVESDTSAFCDFCKILNHNLFTEHIRETSSDFSKVNLQVLTSTKELLISRGSCQHFFSRECSNKCLKSM